MMNSNALDRLLLEVNDPSSKSLTLAPAEGADLVQAQRVSDDDWRLTLSGTPVLADFLEAVVRAAPDGSQGTCRTVTQRGSNHVRLEIGCHGPYLLSRLLEAVIEDHAATHPEVRLLAMLQLDDSLRPRRIDVLVPSCASPQGRIRGGVPDFAI